MAIEVKNQAAINAAKAQQAAAAANVASAQKALSTAQAAAPTKAGASVLAQGGGAEAARYSALASSLNALGAESKLNVAAQTTAEQEALNAAQKAYANISIPSAVLSEDTSTAQSAYDLLLAEFTRYGLASLVEPLKGLVQENISPAEFSLRLQQTDAYKKRFAANADRISKGLAALSPAEYIAMEDQYQNIMRNYGLPASYYAKDSLGTQAGFNQLLANDVSAAELEDRVATAQQRIEQAPPQVKEALKQFYPDITNGDILAYSLDPTKALTDIKRKVTAAEIGGAAALQGMAVNAARAEELGSYGITGAQARQGYTDIAQIQPRGSQLADIYGLEPYTQTTAEQEVFNLGGSAEATKKRKKLTELEKASFSGSSGAASSALSRDRAYQAQSYREPGAGAY